MTQETPETPAPPERSDLIGNVAHVGAAGSKSPRLFLVSVALVAGLLGYLAYTAKVADPIHLQLGLLIIILGFLPGLLWVRTAQFGLPVFETFMATTVSAYGIPLVSGHEQLAGYDVGTITLAALSVILFQLVGIATYLAMSAKPKTSRLWRDNVLSGDLSKYLGYGMFLSTAYSVVDQFTTWIPANLEGPVRAVCYGLGIIATFVECRRWGQGTLPRHEKSVFIVQLVIQIIFNLVSLFLVQAISTLILALLGYVSGSKKFPIVIVAVLLPAFAILHQGKSAMREKYWEGHSPAPTFAQLPAFFTEWFSDGLVTAQPGDAPVEKHTLLDRTSLIQILCLVVSITPDRQPYLYGETYAQIPDQFVPRILWMGEGEKPVGHISTYTLAVYYGLQRMEDTQKTTIGFGLLTEAYANFGLFGVAGISFLFSAFFRKICGWAAESPILSYPGMILIVLSAWSFQDELTMSIWLTSLYQACLVVCAVPYFLKLFLG
jgi:hypothetical protein